MPNRLEWCLLLGVVTCPAVLAAGCEPAVSCSESATCAPIVREDSGIDASDEVGEGDAGSEMDVSADVVVVEPPIDGGVDGGIDATTDSSTGDDVEGGSAEDARHDVLDVADITNITDITDTATEPDACDPGTSKSPVESACLISEKYGIFVSPRGSDQTGIGTRAAPYKTLVKALQSAKGNVMRVYACDEGTGYPDALTIDATFDGMSLYGGFECTGWSYVTTRRARVRPASGVALNVKALTVGLTVEDFEFDTADAAVGESSIGGIVDSSVNVVMRGVKILAGKGGAGVSGADGAKGGDAPDAGNQQQGAPAMCPSSVSQQNGGGWGGPTTCGSRGGNGGQATRGLDGANGLGGIPTTDVTTPNVGAGGAPGDDGAAGSDGNPGLPGATSSAAGLFAAAGYSVAPPGGNGTDGSTAQGGGGGGASNASGLCIGASGGAGGVGGCGGSLGIGGASAGASVALLAWMSSLTLDRCDLTSAVGGAGGAGGNGGKGGAGKAGATGGAGYASDAGPASDAGTAPGNGGSGGPGGDGGNGGSGAGGNGGPSYALVYKGTAPIRLNGTVLAHGAGGPKGTGGSVDTVKAPDGVLGGAADDFPVP